MSEQIIKNQILDELTWNSDLDCWSSQIEITPDNLVNLSVDTEDVETTAVIELACHSFIRLQEQEINYRHCAANQLLDLYNHIWSNGDEIDCQSFMKLIKLEDIHFNFDGSANLYYDDGDLFCGHTIIVSIDCNGAFEDARIAG
ncbi:MAG: DUF2262 domain-containing protein [Aulosira sp. ZfuVER01]|nr:DUF2262 domain-containing protein [Aulosira sp. ZfuVER01]MDZ8002996.1 DUF2262 domain-containing protein [Aulosira sp. DedVER01a]MDZ8053489.1 DUF2262 domain-containing protein [Aulosira sp. ZfuCHP01]